MTQQTKVKENLYNTEIRLLFKQLICETDRLYQQVVNCLPSSTMTTESHTTVSSSTQG